MRMLLSALVLFFGVAGARTSSFAQSGWYWQNPLPTGNHLSAAAALNASTVVAVGDNGTILRTTDGGATWTPQSSGTSNHLYAVSFVDASIGTAVGLGTILRTIDGGATWTPQSSGAIRYLNAVSFVDADIGTAVGEAGTILRTTDGGATWTPQSSGKPTEHLSAVSFVNANTGTAVGSSGAILRTTDGGATWTRQSSGTTHWLQGVSFVNANTSGAGAAVLGGGLAHHGPETNIHAYERRSLCWFYLVGCTPPSGCNAKGREGMT